MAMEAAETSETTESNHLITAAFENAVRDFKATLKDDKLLKEISEVTTIDQVYDATDALQKEQRRTGRLRNLARIQPYLEGLRSYSAVIEVLIQSYQQVLPLIWGPIKFLLQWADSMKQSFDAIVDAFADVGLLLPEFTGVRQLFSQNEHIKDVLVLFFRDILDFYLIVLKFFSKSYWGLVFESMWATQRKKVNLVREQIKRHALLLRREVRLEHIQQADCARIQALEHYEKVEMDARRQEFQALRTNIAPRTYYAKFNWFYDRVCRGTGQWLLKDMNFLKWLDMTNQSLKFLWLRGIPGAGKTFLTSTVINRAKEEKQTRTIYAFLSYTFSTSLSALSILHSLIFHLAEGHDDLQDVLRRSNIEELKSSVTEATDLLKSLVQCAGPTYIIIDGVDEIDELESLRLLKQVLDISQSCPNVSVLVSGRSDADTLDLLRNQVSISVDTRNTESLQIFVDQRINQWFSNCDILPQAQIEIQNLLSPLAVNAQGMFLYVKIVLGSVESLEDMTEIREELRILPNTLDDAYSRILQRVNDLQPSLREKVRKIFAWIGCAPTPMTTREIEQALVVSRENHEGSAEVITSLNMPKICGPIIEVVDEYVQFVHFTVKDEQIPGSLDYQNSLSSLTICCITYLCQQHHDSNMSDDIISKNILSGKYRFHDFADHNWFELFKRYLLTLGGEPIASSIVEMVDLLKQERYSESPHEDDEPIHSLVLEYSDSLSTDSLSFLSHVARFLSTSKENQFSKENVQEWVHLIPSTIPATSFQIYQQLNRLLSQSSEENAVVLQRHYGTRLFKCPILSCSFRRHGFETKSLQKAHINHHSRPWKCHVTSCHYFKKGFLSERMRENHFKDHEPAETQYEKIGDDLDEDGIKLLLFDLVKLDRVEDVKNTLKNISHDPEFLGRLGDHAASFASFALVELINQARGGDFQISQIGCAIQASNTEVWKLLFRGLYETSESPHHYEYCVLLADVLKSDSEEIFAEWVRCYNKEFKYYQKYMIKEPNSLADPLDDREYLLLPWRYNVIKATAEVPGREDRLIRVWKMFPPQYPTESRLLAMTQVLSAVASTTCSVKLAKYLLDEGASLNHGNNTNKLTALQLAARKDTAAAAELMRYLLLHGADPEAVCTRAKLRIREEKGAKEISRWLHISWDELIAETKEERKSGSHDL